MIEKNITVQPNYCPLTVVIATLGGGTLATTLAHLNQGAVVPAEILICIPEEESHHLKIKLAENVKVISTPCRGQVAQRLIGFANASHSYVMQLDDDVIVDAHCVKYLIDTINLAGSKAAISPALIVKGNGESFYRQPRSHFFLNIYYWILNGALGYQPGSITLAGTNIGIDHKVFKSKVVEVEWLPGGCVLHLKKNLILENFYPFKGKAYSEDLFHSFFLKQKEIKLTVCTFAYCHIEDNSIVDNFSFKKFFEYLRKDYKARKFLINIQSKSNFRMYLYYMILVLRTLTKMLILIISRIK